MDYILKPFDEERIGKTLEKIKKMQKIGDQDLSIYSPVKNNQNGKIAVPVDERIILLTNADIVYLESSEGKCTIETMDQKYKVSEALVVLEKKLTKPNFFVSTAVSL